MTLSVLWHSRFAYKERTYKWWPDKRD